MTLTPSRNCFSAVLDQVDTLPADVCPNAAILSELRQVVAILTTPVSQGFVARVIADESLMRGYFIVAASYDDHHPGAMGRRSAVLRSANHY